MHAEGALMLSRQAETTFVKCEAAGGGGGAAVHSMRINGTAKFLNCVSHGESGGGGTILGKTAGHNQHAVPSPCRTLRAKRQF